ncbi:MAG: peptidoglycan D,D-transpeptidase FtsI family protein [Aquificaceae bacterium]|jgi:cell division protein FtsI (penicillin-binding protein 3)|uniref:peptidoglycan D,D-transpeptidase FtsI family protein n=1 Tax=Hydrogenobacter sp. Uz 6-8 TaxID=3384828 RepID=UPI000F1D5674|nr:MAG: penicillin-binding protein 2 [Aquificota bacterium]
MQNLKGSNAKISLVSFLIFLGFALITLRFAYIQLIGKESYVDKVVERFPKASVVRLSTPRGSIKDRRGNDLAISIPTVSIYAFPHLVQNRDELVRRLSALPEIREKELTEKLNSDRKFVWLVRHLDKVYMPYLRAVIRDTENGKAVGLQEEYKRFYPHGNLASNLLGFVGKDGEGLEGLEYIFDRDLKGKEIKGVFYLGRLAVSPLSEDMNSKDVQLTIDLGVQTILEDIRDKIVKQWSPDRVGILLMDARTGEILGMANYPTFDPNHYQRFPPSHRRNFVVTDLFEPGSVMKPFFIGQALQKGYVKPGIWIDTEGGRTEVFGRYVKDVKPSGRLTLEQVLVKSSNVGTIKVARYLSKRDVEEILEKIHMTDRFNLLPGEVKPRLPNFSYPANILYASIGQGLASNLLNLCVSFNALATNRIVKPRILLDEKTQVLRENIYTPQVFGWLQTNLTKVVEEGTATRARSDYFTIAGKTGTSQKFDFSTGRYSREELVTYFVGYFPASDPRFIAGIMVDRPRGPDPYGGTVAAPHFKELVERVAFYYRLEPDKLSKQLSLLSRQ